jgi:hypothetical protein
MRNRGSRSRLAGTALLTVLVGVCCAVVEAGQVHTGPDGRPRIDLVWFDPLNVLPCASRDVGREVAAVFDELGVETTWMAGSADEPTEPPQLNVVFLAAVPSPTLPADTLGVVSARRNTRTVWIVVPNVLGTIGVADGAPMGFGVTAAQVARALGRVVAHEVVHLAAPRLGHTRDGLMQAKLGRSALTTSTLRLDAASRRAVLPGLARLADPAARLETLTIVG